MYRKHFSEHNQVKPSYAFMITPNSKFTTVEEIEISLPCILRSWLIELSNEIFSNLTIMVFVDKVSFN